MKHVKLAALLAALALVAGALAVAVHANPQGAGVADGQITPSTSAQIGLLTNSGVRGQVHAIATPSDKTIVSVHAERLAPGARYGVHLHVGRCDEFLGHLRYDPAGIGERANEVWLDLAANGAGRANDDVTVRALDLPQPLSVVVHQHANADVEAGPDRPGPRIACGNIATRA